MKNALVLFTSLLVLFALPVSAQFVGAPNPNFDFSTGGVPNNSLGHLQNGPFSLYGDVSDVDANWASIGESPFPPGAGPYGLRIQRALQFGVLNLVANPGGSVNEEDLILGWGENTDNQFRLRFVSDQFAPAFVDALVANSNGQVGILTDPGGTASLEVQGPTTGGFTSGILSRAGGMNYAIQGQNGLTSVYGINNGSSTMDIYAVLGASLGANIATNAYGVLGLAQQATGVSYGVRGDATVNPGANWAGYFNGRVFSSGGYFPSDRQLKTNIVEETNVLDQLMKLNTYTYNYKNEEFPGLALEEDLQHGFIAQELEEIFPEMVTEVTHTNIDLKNLGQSTNLEIKAVNYNQMIPVLTTAIKEQQVMIEEQQAQIAELRELVEELNAASSGSSKFDQLQGSIKSELFQNAPNPFSDRTVISYRIPSGKTATVYVFDMNGRQIREFTNLTGEELVIEGSTLEAGMYFYNLVVDGQEVDVKRMVLTK